MIAGVDVLLVTFATVNKTQAYAAALCALTGSLIGSLFLFSLAKKGGHTFLEKYTMTGKGAKIRSWFERYGLLTVFIPALSPIPMPLKIPILSAGALEVRTITFISVILLARFLRYFGLAYLATHFGEDTLPFLKAHAGQVLIVVGLLAALALLLLRFLNRNQAPNPGSVGLTGSE